MDILKITYATLASAAMLFLLTKLMGNKQISQLDMFDYVTGITIGSIAAEMAINLENGSMLEPITAMAIYGTLAVAISFVTEKSRKMRKFFTGMPILILDNGRIYKKNMRRARIDLGDFLSQCRIAGYFDIGQIQTAILEPDGHLSILPKAGHHPATPNDLQLSVEQETALKNVVGDGKTIPEGLRAAGKNEEWLRRQLKAQGYKDETEIFFAACDDMGSLSVYPISTEKPPVDWIE